MNVVLALMKSHAEIRAQTLMNKKEIISFKELLWHEMSKYSRKTFVWFFFCTQNLKFALTLIVLSAFKFFHLHNKSLISLSGKHKNISFAGLIRNTIHLFMLLMMLWHVCMIYDCQLCATISKQSTQITNKIKCWDGF